MAISFRTASNDETGNTSIAAAKSIQKEAQDALRRAREISDKLDTITDPEEKARLEQQAVDAGEQAIRLSRLVKSLVKR